MSSHPSLESIHVPQLLLWAGSLHSSSRTMTHLIPKDRRGDSMHARVRETKKHRDPHSCPLCAQMGRGTALQPNVLNLVIYSSQGLGCPHRVTNTQSGEPRPCLVHWEQPGLPCWWGAQPCQAHLEMRCSPHSIVLDPDVRNAMLLLSWNCSAMNTVGGVGYYRVVCFLLIVLEHSVLTVALWWLR